MARQPIKYSNGRVPDSRIGVPGFSEERDVFGLVGRAGIGSTEFVADYNLDVRGDFKATRIIDVDGSDGEFAYFLTKDIDGLRWVAAPPFDTNSIFIAEDGDILGVTSFTGINIISDQLLGISTNPINPNLADIRLDPRWIRDRSGESADEETAGIYTTRKVGIGSTIPQYFLDVVGDAQIDGDLNVTGILTANSIDGDFGDFGDIVADNLFVNGLSTFVGPSTFFDGISIASTGGPLQVGGLTTITSGIISTRVVDARFVDVFDFETVQFRSQGIATFTGIGITANQANIGVLTVRDFLDVDAGIATFSEDTTVFVGGGTTIRSGIVSTGIVDAEFVNVKDFTTIRLDVTGIATIRELQVLGAGLTVVGVTTLAGALDANGDVDIDGQTELDDLNVSGVSTFGDTVEITSLTEDRVVIVGAGSTLEDDPNFTFDGSQLAVGVGLTITGVSTFAGAIDANSSLNVEGTSTFQADATFQQDAIVDQNLLVSGASTVTGLSTFQSDASFLVDVTIDENLLVTGITTLNDLLDANNGARVNDINLAITGENIIDTAVGILTLDSAGNSVIVDADFLVTGVSTFQNITFFEQNSTFDENVSIGASVNIVGVTTIGGFTDINDDLDVQGDALVGGGLTVIGDSRLDGTVSAGSSINAPLFVTGAGSSGFTISTDTILGPEVIFIDPQSPLGINSGTVRIRGDLFVDGSQFTVDSSIIELADFKVAIATGIATEFLLDGAGIGIGSENIQKNFVYSFGAGVLQSDTGLGVTATGDFKVGVDTVLSAGVLGPTITESSLEDVGELRELIVLGVATALTFDGQVFSGVGTITNLEVDDLVVNNNAGIRSVFAQTGFITALAGEDADFDYGNFDILNTEVGIGTTMSGENLFYTTGIITDLSGTNAYYSVGDFQTLQAPVGFITDLRSTNAFSTVVDAQELYAVTGVVTDLSGTNAYYNTVDAQNLNAVVGFVTDIRSTNAFSTVVDTQELYAVTGVITDLSGTNAYYSVGDLQTLQAVAGVVTDLSGTNAYYSVGDFQTLNAVAGVVTDIRSTNAFSTVVDTQELYAVTGVVTDLSGTNVYYDLGDFQRLQAVTGVVTNLTADRLDVTGISTLQGDVNIGAGATTAFFDVSTGRVGINTQTPAVTLDVLGVIAAADPGGNGINVTLGSDANRNIDVGAGATDLATYIDLYGSLSYPDYAARIIRNAGDNTTLSIINRGTGSLDLTAQDAGRVSFKTNNIVRARINPDGNVVVNNDVDVSGVVTASRFDGSADNRFTGLSSNFNAAVGLLSASGYVGGAVTQIDFLSNISVTLDPTDSTTALIDISSAPAADIAENVIGGIADIIALKVTGPSTFIGNIEQTSGITSLGNLTVSGGASISGVLTAIGDGLTGVSSNFVSAIGVQSAGFLVGASFTTLNFIGSGLTVTVEVNDEFTDVADINIVRVAAADTSDLAFDVIGGRADITQLNVNGPSTMTGTVEMNGQVTLRGDLDVTGVTTTFGFIATDAYIETGDFQTLNAVTGVITDLSGTNAYYSVGDFQTLQGVVGVVTDLSGTNAYYSVVDAQTLQGVAGVVTDLSGTNAYYSVGDFQTLQAVAGVVTDLRTTNTFSTVTDTQELFAVSGVVTNFTGTAATITNLRTTNSFSTVTDTQELYAVAGVVTDLSGTNAYYSVVDAQTLQAVAGVVTDLSGTNAYYTTGDLQTLNAVTGVITNFTGGLASVDQLNSTGVVTASRFDGTADDRFTGLSSNFNAAVGILSAGTYVGGAFTQLNFSGTNLEVTVDPEPGNITQANINILRVATADDAETAFNVIGGVGSITTLDVSGISTLTGQVLVENDISVAGVITATNFIGAADDRFTGLSSQFNGAVGILSANNYISGVITQINFTGTNLDVSVTVPADNLTQADVDILRVSGADEADFAQFSGVATSVIGGIASVTALDVVGLTTLTGQVLVEGDVNVLGVVTANAFNGNINAGVGTITDLNGTNVYYSVVDAQTLQAVSGVVTDLSGTNAYYTTGDFQTLQAVTGVITNFTGGLASVDQLNSTGVVTASNFVGAADDRFTGLSSQFNGAIGILSANNYISGVITQINFTGTNLDVNVTVPADNLTQADVDILRVSEAEEADFAQFSGVATSVIGGIASVTALDVVGLTTLTGQVLVEGDVNVLGVVTANAFNGNINAGVGTITDLNGTNAFYNVGDFQTLQAPTGVITDLSGTNAFYSVVDAQTLNAVAGVVTDISGTNAFYNIVDAQTVNAVSGVITNLTIDNTLFVDVLDAQELYAVTGVITDFTAGIVSTNNLFVTGPSTFEGSVQMPSLTVDGNGAVGGNLEVTGITTLNQLNLNDLVVNGITTTFGFIATDAYIETGDFQTLNAVTGVVTDLSGTNAFYTLGDFQTLQAPVGFITTLTVVDLFADGGVVTATRFDGDRVTTDTAQFIDLNVTGITTLNITNATNINVSGSATVAGDLTVGGVLTYEDVTNVDSIGLVTARVGLNVGPSGSSVITLDNSGQANFTGIVTAANLKVTGSGFFNIVDTQTLQAVAGVITDLSGTNAYYTTGDLQTLNAVVGFVTDIRSTNAFSTVTDTQELYAVTGVVTDIRSTVTDTQELYAVTGVVTDLSGTNAFYTTGDLQTLNAVAGVVTDLSGTNAYYSVVDTQTLQAVAGVVTDLSGTNAFYDVVDAQTLQGLTGVVTDLSGTNAYYSVGDLQTLQAVTGVVTDLSGTNAFYSVVDAQTLQGVAGVVTDLSGTNAYYSVGDFQTLQGVAGVVTDLSGSNAYYTTGDFQTLQGVAGVITDLSGTNAYYSVGDLQTLQAVAGVVTDLSGTNAYYSVGDLQTLQAVAGVVTDIRSTNAFSTVTDTQELYAVTGVVTNFVGTSATVFDEFNVGAGGTILTAYYDFNLPVGVASVGIGSTQPQALLDVDGDVRIGGNLDVVGIITAENITEFKTVDDISSGFNGITTQFTIATGGTNYLNSEITSAARLLISVGGIVQEPDESQQSGFYISGGTDRTTDPIQLNFAEAPRSSAAFFGIAYGLTVAPALAYVTQETSIINAIIFG